MGSVMAEARSSRRPLVFVASCQDSEDGGIALLGRGESPDSLREIGFWPGLPGILAITANSQETVIYATSTAGGGSVVHCRGGGQLTPLGHCLSGEFAPAIARWTLTAPADI